MRAINHALTGAIIGVASGNPWVALPAALASHYAMDAIPHHDFAKQDYNGPKFKYTLIADTIACFLLVVLLAIWQPQYWVLACFCAFLATAPDLMSINHYLKTRSGKVWKPGLYMRFASRIQWFERPIGGFVEIVWFAAASWLLYVVGR